MTSSLFTISGVLDLQLRMAVGGGFSTHVKLVTTIVSPHVMGMDFHFLVGFVRLLPFFGVCIYMFNLDKGRYSAFIMQFLHAFGPICGVSKMSMTKLKFL